MYISPTHNCVMVYDVHNTINIINLTSYVHIVKFVHMFTLKAMEIQGRIHLLKCVHIVYRRKLYHPIIGAAPPRNFKQK